MFSFDKINFSYFERLCVKFRSMFGDSHLPQKNQKRKLSEGNRLAGCLYVHIAMIASFFHELYLVAFACKTIFAQKFVSLKIFKKCYL